jgi:hypothetical protein
MKLFSDLLNIEHHECDLPAITFFDPDLCRYEALKRNAEIVECNRCGVKGNRPNMMRWHFEKCKTVIKTCKQCGQNIPRQGIKDHMYKTKIFCNRKCYMESKKGVVPIEMTAEVREKLSVSRKLYNERLKSNKIK